MKRFVVTLSAVLILVLGISAFSPEALAIRQPVSHSPSSPSEYSTGDDDQPGKDSGGWEPPPGAPQGVGTVTENQKRRVEIQPCGMRPWGLWARVRAQLEYRIIRLLHATQRKP